MATGNDAFLWYNVGDWAAYGLAVPNGGNDHQSQNDTIRYFTDIIGRNLQAVMWHQDARLATPPSINTIRRVHKLCVRVRALLASRAVPPGTNNMETAHAVPAAEEFRVYPTPYFNVRNQWLKQYCGLSVIALTEAMQHSENAKVMEISMVFAGQIGQYFDRIYRTMSVDLLNIPLADASALGFTLTDEQLAAYDPSKFFTSTEMVDTVPDLNNWPTEDDLLPLTNGIPVSQLPVLGRFPSGIGGSNTATGTNATSSNTSFVPAPSP